MRPTIIALTLASSIVVGGTATWYRAPAGTAAAGSELRQAIGPGWRGTRVRVCRRSNPDRCTRVTLTDWCACRGERIIDLAATNFSRIAPLWRGVVRVRVKVID